MTAEFDDGGSGTEPDPVSPSRSEPQAEIGSSVRETLAPLLRPKRRPTRAPQDGTGEAAELDVMPERIDAMPLESRMGSGFGLDDGDGDEAPRTFAEIGEDLERRSRRSAAMVRLLDQHRQQLQTAEKERDGAYDKLARVVPVVQETAAALRAAMDARKIDEDPTHLHRLFMLNGRALDELEKVAVTLFADFLWVKSSWEQYARTVEEARRLRAPNLR